MSALAAEAVVKSYKTLFASCAAQMPFGDRAQADVRRAAEAGLRLGISFEMVENSNAADIGQVFDDMRARHLLTVHPRGWRR